MDDDSTVVLCALDFLRFLTRFCQTLSYLACVKHLSNGLHPTWLSRCKWPIARDKDQEKRASMISYCGTSVLGGYKLPPKVHQCANVSCLRRIQGYVITPTKRPFTELPLYCLEVASRLGSRWQPCKMRLYSIGACFSSLIIICYTKSWRFQADCSRCKWLWLSHGKFLLSLNSIYNIFMAAVASLWS